VIYTLENNKDNNISHDIIIINYNNNLNNIELKNNNIRIKISKLNNIFLSSYLLKLIIFCYFAS